jgi:serine/threonine protein kinase
VFWAGQTQGGTWFLVMEYVKGKPLSEFLSGGDRLGQDEVVQVGEQLLDALAAIHPSAEVLAQLEAGTADTADGLVHRDIKPENIMLTRAGGVKLLDFNIASRAGARVETMSATPPYLAPDIDYESVWEVSADLFATGVVLYELFCHSHPYEHADPVRGNGPIPPAEHGINLPEKLSRFLLQACSKTKEDRFGSASEMLDALRKSMTQQP